MQDIKPSIKSVEGQSVIGVLLTCVGFLYAVLVGDGDSSVPIQDLLASADSAKQIAEAYIQSETPWTTEAGELGKTGAILWFMYKIYTKFTDTRTQLKMKQLETK